MTTIYALVNPINKEIFYIGATANLDSRFSTHISFSKVKDTPKDIYIRQILSKGLRPELLVLDTCEPFHAWFWEEHYINLYRSWGFSLIQSSSYQKYSVDNAFRIFMRKRNKKVDPATYLGLLLKWCKLSNINSLKNRSQTL